LNRFFERKKEVLRKETLRIGLKKQTDKLTGKLRQRNGFQINACSNIIHTTALAGANLSGAYFDALPVAHSPGFASGYPEMFLYLAFGGFIGISLPVRAKNYHFRYIVKFYKILEKIS